MIKCSVIIMVNYLFFTLYFMKVTEIPKAMTQIFEPTLMFWRQPCSVSLGGSWWQRMPESISEPIGHVQE